VFDKLMTNLLTNYFLFTKYESTKSEGPEDEDLFVPEPATPVIIVVNSSFTIFAPTPVINSFACCFAISLNCRAPQRPDVDGLRRCAWHWE
jgi:hypothetical protein